MIELEPAEHCKVAPLFSTILHSVALVHSVLEGKAGARVFVDRAERPQVVLLAHEAGFQYLAAAGIPDKDATSEIIATLFEQILLHADEQEMVLFVFGEGLRQALVVPLTERGAVTIARKVFCYDPVKHQPLPSWRDWAPHGLTVAVQQSSTSDGRFAVTLMRGEQQISLCQTVCVGRGMAEIDIHTIEEERGKGYARLTASTLIEECLRRNLTPCWSCWPERVASVKLAQRLGFMPQPDAPAFFWMPNM